MIWYQVALKRVLKGIIFFLLPVILLVIILEKAFSIVEAMIQPIKNHLPEANILGVGLITLISIFLILLVCYLAGILAERKAVKSLISKFEDYVLVLIPGYAMLKSRAGVAIGDSDDKWVVVLMGDNDDWKMGIQVERHNGGYCSIFFPEPSTAQSKIFILSLSADLS